LSAIVRDCTVLGSNRSVYHRGCRNVVHRLFVARIVLLAGLVGGFERIEHGRCPWLIRVGGRALPHIGSTFSCSLIALFNRPAEQTIGFPSLSSPLLFDASYYHRTFGTRTEMIVGGLKFRTITMSADQRLIDHVATFFIPRSRGHCSRPSTSTSDNCLYKTSSIAFIRPAE